ncbi:unnamed protein product [Effrenium voratum]|nr:unnamed protein product [Effrenium voratum]
MCRMCALISDESVLLADILLRPRMSLVHQSYAARERRALPQGVSPSMAYQQPCLNADGFGVGWYAQQAPLPCVFTSLKPAWNDPNLRNLSEEVRSPLIFAHIRAAGPFSSVNEAACHPFKAGRFLFAHNGLVGNFAHIRRPLLASLNEYAFGITLEHACIDSVVAFGIFLTELGVTSDEDAMDERTADSLCTALSRTVLRLTQAAAEHGPEDLLVSWMASASLRAAMAQPLQQILVILKTERFLRGFHEGVESAPRAAKASVAESQEVTSNEIEPPPVHQDVWMSITAASESGDVNCLVTLSENVFAAGSMDGSLRFFHAEQGQALAVRRHSQASGPVLALLFLPRTCSTAPLRGKCRLVEMNPQWRGINSECLQHGVSAKDSIASPAESFHFAPNQGHLLSIAGNLENALLAAIRFRLTVKLSSFQLLAAAFFSGDAYGRIRVWDAASVQHGSKAVLCSGGVGCAAILTLALLQKTGVCEGPPLVIAGTASREFVQSWEWALQVTRLESCESGRGLRKTSFTKVMQVSCEDGGVKLAYLDLVSSAKILLSPSRRICGMFCQSQDCGHEDVVEFQRLVSLLGEFVALQTVSSDSRNDGEMRKASSWLATKFEELLGATVRISPGGVVARCGWDSNKPLVIMYSHYDVVAAGKCWNTDPWKMVAKDGYFYGRGVSDNKGPMLAQIFAVRRLLQGEADFCLSGFDTETFQENHCPVNVLFIVDAAEESGDPTQTIRMVQDARNDGWLRGDTIGLIINNSQWIDDERPCLCYGMRGVVDFEVAVQGGERDLHSGVNGGLVPEPIFDLVALLGSLVDASGVPTVAGLCDGVPQVEDKDMQNLTAASQQMSVGKISKRLGLQSDSAGPAWLHSLQNPGLEALKRTWLQPCLSITEVGRGPRHQHGRHIANRASCVVSVRTPGRENLV